MINILILPSFSAEMTPISHYNLIHPKIKYSTEVQGLYESRGDARHTYLVSSYGCGMPVTYEMLGHVGAL